MIDVIRSSTRRMHTWLSAELPTAHEGRTRIQPWQSVAGWWQTYPAAADACVAGALLLAVMPQMLYQARVAGPLLIAYALLSGAFVVSLLFRRRAPLAVFCAVTGIGAAQWLIGVQLTADVAILIALATVAAAYPARGTLLAAGLAEVGAVAAAARWPHGLQFLEMLTILTLGVLAATVTGAYVRSRQRVIVTLRQHNQQLEHGREQHSLLAVADERNRIARDMHDVIAHGLAVIVTLAAGSRGKANRVPDRVDNAVALIEETARTALADARSAIRTIRVDAEHHRPTPTIAHLPALVQTVEAAGLHPTIRVSGSLGGLPMAVQVAVYRVTQEALTNVMRHASDADVTIVLEVASRQLTLDVVSDSVNGEGVAPAEGRGSGVIGMRERVHQLGGLLDVGPTVGSGWRVHAVFPLPPRAKGSAL